MENEVIEFLDLEHSKRGLKYWKDRGIDTNGYYGAYTREDNDAYRFYGVIDGEFNNYRLCDLPLNTKILFLPEEDVFEERVMQVRNNENALWKIRVVILCKNGKYIAWCDCGTLDDAKLATTTKTWNFAKEIEPTQSITLELTSEQIAQVKKQYNLK